jgi:hypothetical protein
MFWLINLSIFIQFSKLCKILSELPLLNYGTCRISLLAYSPMAMGILSGKYHSSGDCGPPDARMNLFKGTYIAMKPGSHSSLSDQFHHVITLSVPPAL